MSENDNYLFFLLGYMLTVEPDNRPDIFQVSFIAFRIAGTSCPVENLNVRMQCFSDSLLYGYVVRNKLRNVLAYFLCIFTYTHSEVALHDGLYVNALGL